jgi:transcriptional regulator with XRE-family HTH domain
VLQTDGVPEDFENALAAAIRRTREQTGRRQEDVAAEARAYGLAWTPATVAAIETGRRHVTAVELLLLPFVLTEAGEAVELKELLAGMGRVALTPDASVDGTLLAAVVSGQASDVVGHRGWDTPRRRIARRAVSAAGALGQYASAYPNLRESDLSLAQQEAAGEAERHAGYRFGCSALDVAMAARSLWGRSLSAERNARAEPDASPQARGRVTRQLLDELEPVLKRRRRGSRRASR